MPLPVVSHILSRGRHRRALRVALPCAALVFVVAPSSARAQRLAVGVEWLQAGAGPLHRRALPSLAASVRHDVRRGQLELGWLRAARPNTTAQGATAGIAAPLTAGRLTLRPGVAALVGRATSTADSGGYHWWASRDTAPTAVDYRARPRLTRGTTVGAGAALAADVRLGAGVAMTGSVRAWRFSGDVLGADRSPVLGGVGVSVRPGAWRHRTPDASTGAGR